MALTSTGVPSVRSSRTDKGTPSSSATAASSSSVHGVRPRNRSDTAIRDIRRLSARSDWRIPRRAVSALTFMAATEDRGSTLPAATWRARAVIR